MVERAVGLNEVAYDGRFSDVAPSDWYALVIAAAVSENLVPTVMYENGTILPNENITLKEMATIIMKIYEFSGGKNFQAYTMDKFEDKEEVYEYAKTYAVKGPVAKF